MIELMPWADGGKQLTTRNYYYFQAGVDSKNTNQDQSSEKHKPSDH
jgi:hypothetical protein